MSQKDDPELVTSGPYGLVRHPIDSGVLLAGVGTAVALSRLWLIAMVLAGIYFVYSATVEERYLTEQFPNDYPMYSRSTKILVPLIFLSGLRWLRHRQRGHPQRRFFINRRGRAPAKHDLGDQVRGYPESRSTPTPDSTRPPYPAGGRRPRTHGRRDSSHSRNALSSA
jgi:hypothetical protein